jgi:HAMP domain-containing protein
MNTINEKLAQITELKNYLRETDYHNHKRSDDLAAGSNNPYQIPQDVLEGRANARNEINVLEAEVERLAEELETELTEE